jgi:signal transduction histidine kinase
VQAEELEHEFSDGRTIHTLAFAKPLFDSQQRPRGAVACMLDVTELKRAEIALREGDRRKDEFLATLAHELRNPLAPIRNGVELLRLGSTDQAHVGEIRGIMERQVEHLTRLVDDLLDVSRITRNKIDLRKQRVDFAEIVAVAIEASRPLIDAAGHSLIVTVPPGPVYLDADATRLAQVFSNLLNNSAKYTEPGGKISLRSEVRGDQLITIVEDNGIGIPCESLAHVFDMFRQVNGAHHRSQNGLGIGLTLVRRLVELHGGTVNVQSEGEGCGSAFTVRLPIAAIERFQGANGDRPESSLSGRRILVVDDNRDSVFTMSSLLRIRGNEVRSAYDGLEAIEVAAEFKPEIILMDVGMPKLNGYEATKRIRQTTWGAGIFIVILSGWGQADDLQRSAAVGCSAHLTKPVDFVLLEQLLAGVRSVGN